MQVKDFTEKLGGYRILNLRPSVYWKDGELLIGGKSIQLHLHGIEEILVQDFFFSPRYGTLEKSKRLLTPRTGKASLFTSSWS